MNELNIEKFYVYKYLSTEEKWRALLLDSDLSNLPNILFGMRIFARNEKEAIAKAKITYDKIHVYDSDKENVRRFAAAALKHFLGDSSIYNNPERKALESAVLLNAEYNKYFESLEKGNNNE